MSAGLPGRAAVVVLAVLTAAAVVAQPAPPAADTPDSSLTRSAPVALDDPWAALEPDVGPRDSRVLRRPPGRTSAPLVKKGQSAGHSWTRTLGALAGVVGLIVLLSWGYRAVIGRGLPALGRVRRPELIEVVSRTPLTARQSLCLVRIGPRLVLIGQSHDTLRALDVISDADLVARLLGENARHRPDSSRAEFQRCLDDEARQYAAADAEAGAAAEARCLAAAQERVAGVLERVRRVAAPAAP